MFTKSVPRDHSQNLIYADQCKSLPDIERLEITSQLPVPYDTPVTVRCETGYLLMGADTITCIKDNRYQSVHGQLPSCKESEFTYNLFLLLSLNHSFCWCFSYPEENLEILADKKWNSQVSEKSYIHHEFISYQSTRNLYRITTWDISSKDEHIVPCELQ